MVIEPYSSEPLGFYNIVGYGKQNQCSCPGA